MDGRRLIAAPGTASGDGCCKGTVVFPCLSNGLLALAGNGLCYKCRNYWQKWALIFAGLIKKGQATAPLSAIEILEGDAICVRPGLSVRDIRGTHRKARYIPRVSFDCKSTRLFS